MTLQLDQKTKQLRDMSLKIFYDMHYKYPDHWLRNNLYFEKTLTRYKFTKEIEAHKNYTYTEVGWLYFGTYKKKYWLDVNIRHGLSRIQFNMMPLNVIESFSINFNNATFSFTAGAYQRRLLSEPFDINYYTLQEELPDKYSLL